MENSELVVISIAYNKYMVSKDVAMCLANAALHGNLREVNSDWATNTTTVGKILDVEFLGSVKLLSPEEAERIKLEKDLADAQKRVAELEQLASGGV